MDFSKSLIFYLNIYFLIKYINKNIINYNITTPKKHIIKVLFTNLNIDPNL